MGVLHSAKQIAGLDTPHIDAPERLATCNGCVFHKEYLGRTWCGTPIVGEVVAVDGVPFVLCGCNMNTKTKLDDAKCSIGLW